MKKNSLLFSNMLPFYFNSKFLSKFQKKHQTRHSLAHLLPSYPYFFLKLTLFIKKFHQQVNCDKHKMAT